MYSSKSLKDSVISASNMFTKFHPESNKESQFLDKSSNVSKKEDNNNINNSINKNESVKEPILAQSIILKKIPNEQIKCIDCNSYLTSSKIIFSCGHYLCSICLSRKILLSKFTLLFPIKSTLTFQCNCNSGEVTFPIKECCSIISKPPETKSKLCKKHSQPFKIYCTECRVWLCEECINVFHDGYFKNHQTSTSESLKSHCFYHKNKIKTCICKQCNELICDECTTDQSTSHCNHPTYSIKQYQKVIQNKKNELKYKTYNDLKMFIKDKQRLICDEFSKEADSSQKIIEKGIEILQELKKNYIEKTEENRKNLKLLFKILRKVYKNFYSELNEEKLNLGSLEFLQKIKNEIENITFSSKDLQKFNAEIESLHKTFQNTFNIKISFSKLNYSKITSFDSISPVTSLGIIEQNGTFVTGHQNGIICVYKSSSSIPEEAHLEIQEHSSPINTIKELKSLSNGGFITGSTDKIMKVWSFDTSSSSTINSNQNYYDKLVSTQRNTIDFSNTDNTFQKTNENKQSDYKVKCLYTIQFMHLGSIIDIIELKDKRIVSSGSDNIIKIWSIPETKEDNFEERKFDNEEIIEMTDGTNYEKCLCQINEDVIASGSGDHKIKLWSIQYKSIKKFLIGHTSYVNVLLLNRKEQLLSGGADGLIIVWDIEENEKLYQYGHKVLRGHQGVVQNIVNINKNKIVSCSNDKSIRIWNLRDLNCVFCINNSHQSVIYGLGVTKDKIIISGGNDSKINFYNADNEEDKNNEDNEESENYNNNDKFYTVANNDDDENYESEWK